MDITHYYVEKGQGEPLILLHGNGESSDYFKNQIDVFAEKYHVYAPDTRGHGKTPRGEAPFTIRQFADDLLCFMDERGIEKAHILGFSDGGNIAMIFAMNHPERVDRLILNGANLSTFGVDPYVNNMIEMQYKVMVWLGQRYEFAHKREELLGLMLFDPNIKPEELRAIRSKTLVMAGTRDLIKKTHTQYIADHIADSRVVFIRGNHFIAAKHPEEYNRAVLDFLAE